MDQRKIWNIEYKKDKNKWHKETKSLPNILKDKVVLEVGVGNGKTMQAILKQKPKKLIAIDISDEAIIIVKDKFNQELVQESITSTSFEDKFFDVIVCYYTLNNMLKDEREHAVKEMHRILKDKGVILFEDFQSGDIRQKSRELEDNTIIKTNGIICHFFTKDEIKSLFKKFSKLKIKVKSFSMIKTLPEKKRKIINCIITE
jgi:MPBQ/MSBQ methyltransferase